MSSAFEFGADQRKRLVPASIPRRRVEQGEMFADIIEDRRNHPPIILCVVQRKGSPEVLFLGQFQTRLEAELAAKHFMSDYLGRHRTSGAGS